MNNGFWPSKIEARIIVTTKDSRQIEYLTSVEIETTAPGKETQVTFSDVSGGIDDLIAQTNSENRNNPNNRVAPLKKKISAELTITAHFTGGYRITNQLPKRIKF